MYPRCAGCGEAMSDHGDKLCKFCRKDNPMEYRPYDTYADAYNYDLHEGDHEYKLPYGAESMIKELKEDIQRLTQQNQDDLFDMMRDKRQDRADMIESIVNLVAEYDMSDTIFGEKLLTLLEGMK